MLSDFAAAGETAVRDLMVASARRTVGDNEVIYLQDDVATHIYFVISGHVRLTYIMGDGSVVLNGILPGGRCFGELAALDEQPHCDTATAIGQTTILCLPVSAFRTAAQRHPQLERALARLVAARHRFYVDVARSLSLKSLSARLAQALLRTADGLGVKATLNGRDVPAVGPVITQADLGLMARGARGNVNRALKNWERQGWVALKDRTIFILDRPRLEVLGFEDE